MSSEFDNFYGNQFGKQSGNPFGEQSGTINISVIIPVLNEANSIARVLHSLQVPGVEVIVVDGGSQDQTVAEAKMLGATVLQTPAGRARQMNAGAQVATGDILLFLHADTCLPSAFAPLVRQTLSQPQVIGGAFDLKIDGEQLGLRWVEWGVRWRSRLFQLPYGDQAIFLKAQTFHHLNGFADLPLMEDFEFVQRLRTQGKLAIVPIPVLTSARRWQKIGVFRTTVINQLAIVAYQLGVSVERIARWYYGQRR